MQRQALIAAGGGLASALLSLGLLAGGGGFALLAYFAPLPLCIVGLMAGLRASFIAGTFSIAVLFVLGGFASAGIYLLSILAPCWVLVYHGLSHRAYANGATGYFMPGEILARLTVLGAAFIGVITILQMGTEAGIEASIRTFLTSSLGPMVGTAEMDQMGLFLDRIVPLFPAFATLSWLVMLIANATLAQALLTKWGTALRATPDYTRIEAPEWSYWLLVAAAALKIVSSGDIEYLAQNLAAILAAPFFFVGLAVAHVMVRRARYPGLALAAFYAMLMFFTWFALLVVAVGFLEPWARLRERYRSAPRSVAPLDEE